MNAAVTQWIEHRINQLYEDIGKFKDPLMIAAWENRIERLSDWLMVTKESKK